MVCDAANEWMQRRPMSTIGDTMTADSSPCASSPPATAAAKLASQQPLKCPRCESSNTKFCYYNNYSLSQPRHFCKACKRYWTRGGTLRNVPVGGGCRKNKRVKKASSAAAAASVSAAAISATSDHLNSLFFSHTLPVPMYDIQPPQISTLGSGFSSGNPLVQLPGDFLNAYPMPSFDQELDLQKQVKLEGESNVTAILDWQAQAQAQAQDPHEMMMNADASSYLYWSSPVPDHISNFSLAPLM